MRALTSSSATTAGISVSAVRQNLKNRTNYGQTVSAGPKLIVAPLPARPSAPGRPIPSDTDVSASPLAGAEADSGAQNQAALLTAVTRLNQLLEQLSAYNGTSGGGPGAIQGDDNHAHSTDKEPPNYATSTTQETVEMELRCSILNVHDVDTASQSFMADLYIDARVRGRADLLSPDAQFNPELYIANAVDVDDTLLDRSFVRDGDAIWHKRYKGIFKDEFHLHTFPFDVQDLKLHIVAGCHCRRVQLVPAAHVPSLFHLRSFALGNVWQLLGVKEEVRTVENDERVATKPYRWLELLTKQSTTDPAESASGHVFSCLTVALFMRRHPAAYIYNIAAPMLVLTSMGVSVWWCKFAGDGLANRLSQDFALLLTAVAYKFIASSGLPILSYLTFLDKYVMACFIFISILVVENVVVHVADSEKLDNGMFGPKPCLVTHNFCRCARC
eukprot:SAG31_NODE_854_length_11497_cov_8.245043_7_plen_444_part_00